MKIIIILSNEVWEVNYTSDSGDHYQEFKTFEEVSRFVEDELLA